MIYPDQEVNKLLGNKVMEASKRGGATCAAYGYGAWKYLVNPSTLKLHETSRSLLNSPKHVEPIQLELPPTSCQDLWYPSPDAGHETPND